MTPQTEEQITELKQRFGEVYELKLPLNDEGTEFTYGYCKKPSRAVMGAYLSMMGNNPLNAQEVLLKNILIAEISDANIITNDDLFYSACTVIASVITIRQAILKKS